MSPPLPSLLCLTLQYDWIISALLSVRENKRWVGKSIPFSPFACALPIIWKITLKCEQLAGAGEQESRPWHSFQPCSAPRFPRDKQWWHAKIHKWHIRSAFSVPQWVSLSLQGNSVLLHSNSTWWIEVSLVTVKWSLPKKANLLKKFWNAFQSQM